MLYPFAWVNDPRSATAAAAGGCMLVDPRRLEEAGGIEVIAGDLIDDCALAALMKRHGPIWLGLTDRARSLRPYRSFAAIGRMVSRSAFAQLGFSTWMLAATVAGMALLYVAPAGHRPLRDWRGADRGAAAWVAMAASYQPMLHFYRLGFWRGALLPLIGACYVAFTLTSAIDHLARTRRHVEGRGPGHWDADMSQIAWDSGKGHGDENFPVASVLIAPRHRSTVLAFYRVARMADDVADHPGAARSDKLARLAAIEASLIGADDSVVQAVTLRRVLQERGLTSRHMLDLLEAFRRDVTKNRYADWDDLMDYCRYSAAPVGRFVLDVHGEPTSLWAASDALCAALQ